MNTLRNCRALFAVILLSCWGHALAADSSPLARDMTATLSLLGMPCGQVVNVVTQGNRDYLVTCSNKNRYRVYVNAQGRVTAEKR